MQTRQKNLARAYFFEEMADFIDEISDALAHATTFIIKQHTECITKGLKEIEFFQFKSTNSQLELKSCICMHIYESL